MSTPLSPSTSPDTEFFWAALKEHRLVIQRCRDCRSLRHPPRPMCPACNSLSWDTLDSTGRGTLYSFVMPQHPRYPWLDYPYIVALIELEEGIRLVSNLGGVSPSQATIGMPVEVDFVHHSEDLVLHQFKPAAT